MTKRGVRVRRAYEEPDPGDGIRVLVDRIWPRGLTKASAALDQCAARDPSSLGLRGRSPRSPITTRNLLCSGGTM
jgi:uncharacterized protein YeaO (DUF488 family)